MRGSAVGGVTVGASQDRQGAASRRSLHGSIFVFFSFFVGEARPRCGKNEVVSRTQWGDYECFGTPLGIPGAERLIPMKSPLTPDHTERELIRESSLSLSNKTWGTPEGTLSQQASEPRAGSPCDGRTRSRPS